MSVSDHIVSKKFLTGAGYTPEIAVLGYATFSNYEKNNPEIKARFEIVSRSTGIVNFYMTFKSVKDFCDTMTIISNGKGEYVDISLVYDAAKDEIIALGDEKMEKFLTLEGFKSMESEDEE